MALLNDTDRQLMIKETFQVFNSILSHRSTFLDTKTSRATGVKLMLPAIYNASQGQDPQFINKKLLTFQPTQISVVSTSATMFTLSGHFHF